MKKGFSRNRHRSKRIRRWKKQRVTKVHYAKNRQNAVYETSLQLTQKNFKWSRFSTIIQVIDFLIDKLPQIIRDCRLILLV